LSGEEDFMDGHLWQQACGFAARAHEGQRRKDGRTPYVAHVYRIALTF
jgi:(p)ppGpp synthase/HD superfamily hydrolase